jgi:hypothetical protein
MAVTYLLVYHKRADVCKCVSGAAGILWYYGEKGEVGFDMARKI